MPVRTCPRCFRVTAEDMDNCPDKHALGCPPPVEESDDKVLVVKCAACPKLRAIPIGNVMQRKRLTQLGVCVRDQCQAEIVLPATKPTRAVPAPITDEAKRGRPGQ